MEKEKMKDLIERQKAIDCVNRSVTKRAARWAIQALPSIQAKRPAGVWEPLGHRMGFLKHPDSEGYKCSICGYESYTLYIFPPKTCPECGADMRKSVKKLCDDMMSVPLPGWEEEDG